MDDPGSTDASRDQISSTVATLTRVLGLLLLLVVGLAYFGSPLMVPIPVAISLWVVWVGFLVLLVRLWKSRPWVVLLIPLFALAFWVGVLQAGSALFGWGP